jgi:hypothetical protein
LIVRSRNLPDQNSTIRGQREPFALPLKSVEPGSRPVPSPSRRDWEAAITIDREAFVRRVRESGELEHLRSRFERLRTMANTHAAEISEWGQRVGHPLRIPRVAFPWPPAAVWDAFLDTVPDAPELRWDDDLRASSA